MTLETKVGYIHSINTPTTNCLLFIYIYFLQVVKICRQAIEKTEPILADTHIYLLRMWSTLSEVQAYLQYFDDAADYARKMVDGYLYVHKDSPCFV